MLHHTDVFKILAWVSKAAFHDYRPSSPNSNSLITILNNSGSALVTFLSDLRTFCFLKTPALYFGGVLVVWFWFFFFGLGFQSKQKSSFFSIIADCFQVAFPGVFHKVYRYCSPNHIVKAKNKKTLTEAVEILQHWSELLQVLGNKISFALFLSFLSGPVRRIS